MTTVMADNPRLQCGRLTVPLKVGLQCSPTIPLTDMTMMVDNPPKR